MVFCYSRTKTDENWKCVTGAYISFLALTALMYPFKTFTLRSQSGPSIELFCFCLFVCLDVCFWIGSRDSYPYVERLLLLLVVQDIYQFLFGFLLLP